MFIDDNSVEYQGDNKRSRSSTKAQMLHLLEPLHSVFHLVCVKSSITRAQLSHSALLSSKNSSVSHITVPWLNLHIKK